LIDTGVVTSCISEHFARTLRLIPQPTPDDVKLILANKSRIRSIGTVNVEMSIQGLVVPFTFHVLQSLSHKVWFAQNCLRFLSAIIDCGNRSISMFDGLVHAALTCFTQRESVLRVAQNVIIPAATEALAGL
jgi:hypothetical protein